jgi:hypothetical protein
MFATRRSRVLVVLGLVALVGLLRFRWRRADARDGVASASVSEDVVADVGTQPESAIDAAPDVPVIAAHDAERADDADADDAYDAADEGEAVTARLYEVSAPPVVGEPVAGGHPAAQPEAPDAPSIDLDRIERDLEGVEAALRRLDDGTYWTDEVTGEALDETLLVSDPVARRNIA